MFKQINILTEAGKWWTSSKMNNFDETIKICALKLIDKLNNISKQDYNVEIVVKLICTAAFYACNDLNLPNKVANYNIKKIVNNILSNNDYNSLDNILDLAYILTEEDLIEARNYFDNVRESIEPDYGTIVIGLILSTLLLQSQNIGKSGYELVTLFLDSSFDIVPSYEDFLLDF